MKLKLGALCERVLVDQESNAVSLIGLIDGLVVEGVQESQKPIETPFSGVFFAVFEAEETEKATSAPMRVSIIAPSGAGSTLDADVQFAGEPIARAQVFIRTLPYEGPGPYSVQIEFRQNGQSTKHSYHFEIRETTNSVASQLPL